MIWATCFGQRSQPPSQSRTARYPVGSLTNRTAQRLDEDDEEPDYTSEEDDAAEKANKNSSSMGTPTAIVLELPPIPFPDKDLLIGQVKRAVGILNEEGFATAADLLRVAGRCAYDAQEAASLPVDVEPVTTAKVRPANGEGEVGREFLINLTIGSFKVALDSLGDYGRLTGHFTDIPQAQRILGVVS